MQAGVARYSPEGKFEETFTTAGRCGPIVPGEPACGSRPTAGAGYLDVDIDQSTGNIFFLNVTEVGKPDITEFNPEGSVVITQFGIQGAFGENATEGPSKIHSSGSGGIAVGDAGEVYVFDEDNPSDFYRRLMVFKPVVPGDPSSYEYVSGGDVGGTPKLSTAGPGSPVLDDDGNIFASGAQTITKYELSKSRSTPTCVFRSTEIKSATVDPATGTVYFYSGLDQKIHILDPCDSEGKFVETKPPFSPTPERGYLFALAYSPAQSFGANTPGVLFGAAATNESGAIGEPQQSSLGYIFSRPQNLEPAVISESVRNVGADVATLNARINPRGSFTRYTFEYLPTAQWEANDPAERFLGATSVPVGEGAGLGSGQESLTATAPIVGLGAGAEYHYRVIATSVQGSAIGPDQVFRTFPVESPGLPGGRVYEQVSPIQKNGGEVRPLAPERASCGPECSPGLVGVRFPVQVSPDGNAIAFQSQPFRLEGGPTESDEDLAARDASGWQTTPLGTYLNHFGGEDSFLSYGFSADLSSSLVGTPDGSLVPEEAQFYLNIFHQQTADPATLFSPALTGAPPARTGGTPYGTQEGATAFQLEYAGASADLSRIFFAANDALTAATDVSPAAPAIQPNERNLYEWSDGELRLVNVAEGNSSAVPGTVFGGAKREALQLDNVSNAISKDGSRVFWSDGAGQVYVREDATTTREIPVAGKFLGADGSGSKVLLDSGKIYDLESGATTDVLNGQGVFEGLVGQTEDLSHLYFVVGPVRGKGDLTLGSTTISNVSTVNGAFAVGQRIEGAGIPEGAIIEAVGPSSLELSAPATSSGSERGILAQKALAPGLTNGSGDVPTVAGENLYSWEEGAVQFVASLQEKDGPSGLGYGDWAAPAVQRTAEPSTDGRWLAFESEAQLTSRENLGLCSSFEEGVTVEGPCKEVYLYDSATGSLVCASCNSVGARSLGPSWVPLPLTGVRNYLQQVHYVTDAGRLYFNSRDRLSQFDDNNGVNDVYEYEPEGVGTCSSPGGCVRLISSGNDGNGSEFLAADSDGRNVFFTTRDKLVAGDRDDLIDLYDARQSGGFPPAAEVAVGCQGEACQPPPLSPAQSTPGSAMVEGARPEVRKAKPHKKKRRHRQKVHKKAGSHKGHSKTKEKSNKHGSRGGNK